MLASRKSIRRAARGVLALFAGAWLLAAVAPCFSAPLAPAPMPAMDCCPDHGALSPAPMDCDALSALHCQLPNPTPPATALDLPAPAVALLTTLPASLTPVLPDNTAAPPPADASPPPPPHHLSRKHSRLLI